MNEAKLELLTSVEDLDDILTRSSERPQLIFKHSLTCPISQRAMREMENYLEGSPSSAVDYYLIQIQNARGVSNEVSSRLGIRHESPQALLIRDGAATWDASHGAINERSLGEQLAAL